MKNKTAMKHFTLIEIIISFFLFSILSVTLAGLFWNYIRYDTLIEEKIEQTAVYQANAARLQKILANAQFEASNKHYFYTIENESSLEIGQSLVFTYDAGVELPPYFSNTNVGKLFVSLDGKLTLASWPAPEHYKSLNPPMKEEVLFENVESHSFQFFSAKENATDKGIEKGTWVDSWDKEYKASPTLVKIRLQIKKTKNSKELIFCCYLPREFPIITYR